MVSFQEGPHDLPGEDKSGTPPNSPKTPSSPRASISSISTKSTEKITSNTESLSEVDKKIDSLRGKILAFKTSGPLDKIDFKADLKDVNSQIASLDKSELARSESIKAKLYDCFKAIAEIESNKVFLAQDVDIQHIEEVLNPNIKVLKEKALQADATPAEKVAHKVAQAELGARIYKPSYIGGATGALVYKDLLGRKIGIFKAEDEKMTFSRKISVRAREAVGFTRQAEQTRLREVDGQQVTIPASYSESAAALADHFFDVHLTPDTSVVKLNEERGSFMLFEQGVEEAHKHFKELQKDKNHQYTKDEINLFQKMVIYDYLIGNLDRHTKNWMIKVENGEVVAIKTIDNANAFKIRNRSDARTIIGFSKDCIIAQKENAWKHLNIAKISFSEESRKFMAAQFTKTKVEDFEEALIKEFSDKEKYPWGELYVSKEMLAGIDERAAVLFRMSELGQGHEDSKPAHLGKLTSTTDIEQFVSPEKKLGKEIEMEDLNKKAA